MTMDCTFRDRILEEARKVIGLNANPQGSRPEYLQLIAPGETSAMMSAMASMSGCALTVAGIWRNAGIKHRKLNPPYVIGSAVSRVVGIAREKSAWIPYKTGELPSPGDMVLIGDNTPDNGVEHVYTVVEAWTEDDKTLLKSIDGGQLDGKYQAIFEKERQWIHGRDQAKKSNDPGANMGAGRKIIGWIDVSKLESLV